MSNGILDWLIGDIDYLRGHTQMDSVGTDDLGGTYPSKIRVTGKDGVVTTIDPDTTTDPVEEAFAAAEAAGYGLVELPPRAEIDHEGPIYARPYTTIRPNGAVINITGNSGGLIADTSQIDYGGGFIYNFDIQGRLHIKGAGPNSGQGGHGVDQVDGFAGCSWMGRVSVDDWDGIAWMERSGSAPYENQFSHIHLADVDAGDVTAMMACEGGGAGEWIGQLSAYPDDSGSASDSEIIRAGVDGGGTKTIESINVGGHGPGRVVSGAFTNLHIGEVNWEPGSQNGTPSWLVQAKTGTVRVGNVVTKGGAVTNGATVGSIYNLTNPGPGTNLGKGDVGGSVTISDVILEIGQDVTQGTVHVEEAAADVDNKTGATLSNPIWCEGDGVYKTSTTTGYDGGTNDRKV